MKDTIAVLLLSLAIHVTLSTCANVKVKQEDAVLAALEASGASIAHIDSLAAGVHLSPAATAAAVRRLAELQCIRIYGTGLSGSTLSHVEYEVTAEGYARLRKSFLEQPIPIIIIGTVFAAGVIWICKGLYGFARNRIEKRKAASEDG